MAKKSVKAQIGKKSVKAIKPVIQQTSVEDSDDATMSPVNPIADLTPEEIDERLSALIAEGQAAYEAIHGEGTSWVPRFMLFWMDDDGTLNDELSQLLLALNTENRYCNPKKVQEYTDTWLTNRRDEHGEPIKGSTRWEKSLPIDVAISDAKKLHNGQKSIRSALDAFKTLQENKLQVMNKSKDVEDLRAKLGLEPSDIQLSGILRDGFADEAADYLDTAEQRTNTDLGYRRRLFAPYDWSFLKSATPADATPDAIAKAGDRFEKRLPKVYQEASKNLVSVLSFVFRRFHSDGCFPRSKPSYGSAFSKDMFRAALAEFPDATDSVYYVRSLMSGANNKLIRSLKVSVPYLMTSHYLASMSDATFNPKLKVWERSEQGYDMASGFIHQLLLGKDYEFFTQWRQAVQKLQGKNETALNNVFNSLGFCWRHYAFSEKPPALQLLITSDTLYPQYAVYSETGEKGEFDRMIKKDVDPRSPQTAAGKPVAIPAKPVSKGPKIAKR